MNTSDLDAIKASWKKEEAFGRNILTENEILAFMEKRSGRMERQYRSSIIMDLIYKGLVVVALVLLMFLVSAPLAKWILPGGIMGLVALIGMAFQINVYRKIPRSTMGGAMIRDTLEKKIKFFHGDFIPAIYIAGLSNPLIFLCGMLYYFFFKYGELRSFAWDDYLVFGTGVVLSYILMVWPLLRQFRFQVRQVESCLKDIDEEGLSEMKLKDHRNKRLRFILAMVLAMVLGILLFNYFLAR